MCVFLFYDDNSMADLRKGANGVIAPPPLISSKGMQNIRYRTEKEIEHKLETSTAWP